MAAAAVLAVTALVGYYTIQGSTLSCSDPAGCPDFVIDVHRLAADREGTFDPPPRIETITFAPEDCDVVEGTVLAGERTLLRFTTTTVNKGKGAFIVPDPAVNPGSFLEWAECHGHYHMAGYSAYRLWTPVQYKEWQVLQRQRGSKVSSDELLAANPDLQPVAGHKQGFCVVDYEPYSTKGQVEPIDDYSGQVYAGCEFPYSGLSPGWADTYWPSVPGQWVDITGLPSGKYVMENEVNPGRVIEESNYRNNSVTIEVVIE